jgi:hypothetical protein
VRFFVLAAVLGDSGIYDKQAKDEALREARKGPFEGAGDAVSVGPVREREECPQAPSAQAGPSST